MFSIDWKKQEKADVQSGVTMFNMIHVAEEVRPERKQYGLKKKYGLKCRVRPSLISDLATVRLDVLIFFPFCSSDSSTSNSSLTSPFARISSSTVI